MFHFKKTPQGRIKNTFGTDQKHRLSETKTSSERFNVPSMFLFRFEHVFDSLRRCFLNETLKHIMKRKETMFHSSKLLIINIFITKNET